MEKSFLFKVKESAVHALEATTQIELFSYQLKGGKSVSLVIVRPKLSTENIIRRK